MYQPVVSPFRQVAKTVYGFNSFPEVARDAHSQILRCRERHHSEPLADHALRLGNQVVE